MCGNIILIVVLEHCAQFPLRDTDFFVLMTNFSARTEFGNGISDHMNAGDHMVMRI